MEPVSHLRRKRFLSPAETQACKPAETHALTHPLKDSLQPPSEAPFFLVEGPAMFAIQKQFLDKFTACHKYEGNMLPIEACPQVIVSVANAVSLVTPMSVVIAALSDS